MTYEKVLEISKIEFRIIKNTKELESQVEFQNKIVKAVEKQIPKKPLPEERYYGIGKCPNCSAVFLDKSTKYCGNCGQALDWSDDE